MTSGEDSRDTNEVPSNPTEAMVPIFKGEAYDCWYIQMKTLFISESLWDLIEDGYKQPKNVAELESWDENKKRQYNENRRKDAKALFYIQQGVSKVIFPRIMAATTAKEAWEILKNAFKGLDKDLNSDNMGANGGASVSEKRRSPSHLQPECCIFRVYNHLREINPTAYKPEIVAIGPYHHRRCSRSKNNSSPSSKETEEEEEEEEERKVNYSMMEEHKWWYLQLMLEAKGVDYGYFVEAIRPKVERVRNFYAEPLSCFSDNELAEIMVLDGCFIIELLRRYADRRLRQKDDPIFKMGWIRWSLRRDLMLFENQLPLFVLHELFGMIEPPNDERRFIQLVLNFFESILPDPRRRWDPREFPLGQVKHVLQLIHLKWCSKITSGQNERMDGGKCDHVIDLIPRCLRRMLTDSSEERRVIRCATELGEAGVKFDKFDNGKSLFDIRFKKGTLQIPTLLVGDSTEAFLRNLIAYEQYWSLNFCQRNSRTSVTEYVCFLDNLIDTSKDVEILCHNGIIHNLLGDAKAVADMLNKIADSIIVPVNNSCYDDIEKRLDSHCKKNWNRWMAMLRHNHFNSPWGILSVVAGLILLFLTSTQTYFTVFPRK